MKTSLLLLALFSSFVFADEAPTQPTPSPEEIKVSPVAEFAYQCTAASGHEQHPLIITVFKELSEREPPLRMKVGGNSMAFTAFEMNGKENMKMLNLAIQASDKKGRSITAQRSEYYGPPPVKGFYVRLAFGKAAISCESK